MVDGIAERYHADPLTVLGWEPLRLGAAIRARYHGAELERQAIEAARREADSGRRGGA